MDQDFHTSLLDEKDNPVLVVPERRKTSGFFSVLSALLGNS